MSDLQIGDVWGRRNPDGSWATDDSWVILTEQDLSLVGSWLDTYNPGEWELVCNFVKDQATIAALLAIPDEEERIGGGMAYGKGWNSALISVQRRMNEVTS